VLGNINNIAELSNAISIRMNDKKVRRWLRIFDIGVLIRHSSFIGKLKVAVKIALRCIGIKKYKFPLSPIIPTEFLNSRLSAINANVEDARRGNIGVVTSSDNNVESEKKAAEQSFIEYKRKRNEKYHLKSSNVGIPCIDGLVSIVLPVYNGGEYLALSIESVLAQSYKYSRNH
jgi:hypothetical protein